MKKNDNLIWLNALRCVATFSVILLHLSVPVVNNFNKILPESWLTGNIINGINRFCVPVFLMISGVLLLGKNYSLETFLTKRITRIVLPFIFWSIIYFLIKINPFDTIEVNIMIFLKGIKQGMEYHLWYIYMIIGLYLFLPIINGWVKNASEHEVIYFLLIWMIVLLLNLPFFNKFFTRIDFRYFSGFIGYAVLGYFLNNYIKFRNRSFFAGIFIFGAIITITLTYFLSIRDNKLNSIFYQYLSPNVILSSCGLFLFFKNISFKNKILINVINFISTYSFGVYLSHVFVIWGFSKLGINVSYSYPLISILGLGFLCLTISLFITFTLSKIPLGKYISG